MEEYEESVFWLRACSFQSVSNYLDHVGVAGLNAYVIAPPDCSSPGATDTAAVSGTSAIRGPSSDAPEIANSGEESVTFSGAKVAAEHLSA